MIDLKDLATALIVAHKLGLPTSPILQKAAETYIAQIRATLKKSNYEINVDGSLLELPY